jgi:hypothetical protein
MSPCTSLHTQDKRKMFRLEVMYISFSNSNNNNNKIYIRCYVSLSLFKMKLVLDIS